jgi:hypothetical protein
MRTSIPRPLLVLTVGALAFGPVAVDPDAEASCTLIRGAETPDDTTDDVSACRQDVWFHGAGLPADNLDNAQGTFAVWDTTPPAESVTAGAGNGVLTSSTLHQQSTPFDERESFVAAGSFDGAIEDLIVELYLFTPGTNVDDPENPVVRGDYSVDAQLRVDGFAIQTLADHVVTLEPAGDAVQRITFAFRGLSDTIELISDLDATHDVEVRVHGTAIVSDVAVMVYDTTEVPAGMVFNPPADVLDELS